MDVRLQTIPVKKSRGGIHDAEHEPILIDVGFAQMDRRAETLLGNHRNAIRPALAAEMQVAAEGGAGNRERGINSARIGFVRN